jgi:hypothetical protein
MPVTIDGSNTPTAGGVIYGDGTEYASTSAGTSGQVLTSAGSSVPTWTSQSALSVGSATTASSATTSTNLAGGSNGTIPYQSASGTTQMLAVGTAGQVLQTNGAGAPTWVTPGGGSWVYLSTVTASGAATADIETTFNSTYAMYAIVAVGVYFTVSQRIGVRLKVGGAYGTDVAYQYAATGANANTGVTTDNSGSYDRINITPNATAPYSDQVASFVTYVPNPSSTTALKMVWGVGGYVATGGYQATMTFSGGYYSDQTALTGVRFFPTNGTGSITGTFRLYGIKNS